MEVSPTAIEGVVELRPTRRGDHRGWFTEVWNASTMADIGISRDWVQDNEAWSAAAGTLRGIHFQLAPRAQDKLVRVVQGSVIDVAVDLRRSSTTFGRHVAVELSAEKGNQLFVPKGFGHAYCTLEANCIIGYKVSDFYSPEHDRGVRWNDPHLAVTWPFDTADAVLSDKDQTAPLLSEATDLFD